MFYDGADSKLSSIIDLNAVQFVDIDDRDLGPKDLELIGYSRFRIRKEPNWLKKLYFRIKWYFEDRKKGNKNV
jgi:hypothetical protein